MAHIIVLGNEKGGTGKSTTAVHIAVSLVHAGLRVGAIDIDARQRTFDRYLENRRRYAGRTGLELPTPDNVVIPDHSETLDRARADGGTVDWVVLRNRLSSLEARNMRRVGNALDELAKRVGFRVIAGLSERVIYRELFPKGLTLLDLAVIEDASLSHVAARAELRSLVASLSLPALALPAREAVSA